MKYLLDTNIIITAIDGEQRRLHQRLAMCDDGDMVTSAIAYAEAAHGAATGKPPPLELLDRFLEDIPVLPFDGAAGAVYATLPFRRGSFDRLIAAHALSLGVTVVTNNERDFADIPGLVVENWTR